MISKSNIVPSKWVHLPQSLSFWFGHILQDQPVPFQCAQHRVETGYILQVIFWWMKKSLENIRFERGRKTGSTNNRTRRCFHEHVAMPWKKVTVFNDSNRFFPSGSYWEPPKWLVAFFVAEWLSWHMYSNHLPNTTKCVVSICLSFTWVL